MLCVRISENGKEKSLQKFTQNEISLGRIADNDIVLPKSNISKRHARISKQHHHLILTDSKSTNGTYVNGKRLHTSWELQPGDKIFIGGFTLEVSILPDEPEDQLLKTQRLGTLPEKDLGTLAPKLGGSSAAAALNDLSLPLELERLPPPLKEPLLSELELESIKPEQAVPLSYTAPGDELRHSPPPAEVAPATIIAHEGPRNLDFGTLTELYNDPTIQAIFVNGPKEIFVERQAQLRKVEVSFINDEAVLSLINRLLLPLKLQLSPETPIIATKLADGTHLHAIHALLSLQATSLSIYKKLTPEPHLEPEQLVAAGTLTAEMVQFLKEALVTERKNILVSGENTADNYRVLNMLGNLLTGNERILVIEERARLSFNKPNIVHLESYQLPFKQPIPCNQQAVLPLILYDVPQLIAQIPLMHPDRVILGQCRDLAAPLFLNLLSTGLSGSLTSIYARSPLDALLRLENLLLLHTPHKDYEVARKAIRSQISYGINLLVHVKRTNDQVCRITSISEVMFNNAAEEMLENVFVYNEK